MNVPRIIIAGTHSGAGKTSVTLGLIGALRRRGLAVQPFKVGPDFTDASLLTAAAGRPSRNLDTWMIPKGTVLELFVRGSEGADVAVAEGVMGLYDGYRGGGEEGSTAEVAKLLHAPVVLVIDVSGSVRSAAATAMGFVAFDPGVAIAGVIADRVEGDRHLGWLRDALAGAGIPLLGAIPSDERLAMPERHWDLVPASTFEALADAAARSVNVDRIIGLARQAPPVVVPGQSAFPAMTPPATVSIGIAVDRAFSFYYQDSLDLLRSRGAMLVPFSPMADAALPPVHGLYLGGGYPERHAAELAANDSMRRRIGEAVAGGMPVYAECGGMMYLARSLADTEGHEYTMVGALPLAVRAQRVPSTIGYATLEATEDSLLLREGEVVRGHVYHAAAIAPQEPLRFAFHVAEGHGMVDGRDGIMGPSLLASFTHLHFASKPVMAERFVEACRRYKSGSREQGAGSRT